VLANRLIRQGEIPREFLPSTALTDSTVISGKVARTDLAAGQVVVAGMFVDQAEVVASWSDRLEVGEVAVTISLDQVRSVGGLIQPGDRVSMLVETTPTADDPAAPAGGKTVRHLYQNVEILAIGNVGVGQTPDNGQVPSSGLITLAVPPDAAQRIVYARDSIYLLLEPKNFLATDLPPIDAGNLFDKPLTPAPDAG
jgi:Flp pilus assembly protein CpaB